MSNYPDGMTKRDWEYLDGRDHHEDCPENLDFDHDPPDACCEHDKNGRCGCGCRCEELYPSKYDIELEKLGL